MIATYSQYIERFLNASGLRDRPCPGEHHFVSAYLVPRLFQLNQRVPDYINPDGTKGIVGDVVYYRDHQHQFGIEAKLGTVRLTKGEFNSWIVSEDSSSWPDAFLGIGSSGIGICDWSEFRHVYIASVRERYAGWRPIQIDSGYGPMKSVNIVLSGLRNRSFFPFASDAEEAEQLEASFIGALQRVVDC